MMSYRVSITFTGDKADHSLVSPRYADEEEARSEFRAIRKVLEGSRAGDLARSWAQLPAASVLAVQIVEDEQ